MLDTIRTVETPEGMELELRVAGPAVRALAWLIDLLIRLVLFAALAGVLGLLGAAGVGLLLILYFLLEWGYPVLFEVYRGGVTPGKAALGLRVLQDDGSPVGWGASTVRNLLRAADFLPLLYGFGLIACCLTRDFKRLGDLAAGTVVVHRDPPSAPARAAASVPPLPPPQPLTPAEQRALVELTERAQWLSPERREELAELAQPLTGASGGPGWQRLQQYAGWLLGQR